MSVIHLAQTRTTRVLLASILLSAAVGCAIVLLSGASGADATAQSPEEASPASSFALLRESATSAPPAEVIAAAEHAPALFGLEPQAARQAPGTGAWLIPGDGELCLAVEDSEGMGLSCSPLAEANAGHLTFLERSTNGGPNTVIGAAPDGMASAAGHNAAGEAVASALVQSNTYVMSAIGLTGTTLSP
jgi:hypothetical protein